MATIRLLLLALSGIATAHAADAAPPVHDIAVIEGNAGTALSGIASINMAAGRGNAQANVGAITLGAGGNAMAMASQATEVAADDLGRDASARITGNALSLGTGVLAVNQAAGAANAQLNLFAIAACDADALVFFAQAIDTAALAAVSSGNSLEPEALSPAAVREARIDAGAITRPQGVLQLNQTAGVGNASANAIVLRIPGSAP
ncbi:MAG: hypothetical protein EPO46_03255 [Lysobacter sp.]|nr:MAG: hypothetical protein EPO46_03255 [Lysobacter sp.]